jgi:TIR domain
MDATHDIFLSHSSANKDFVRNLFNDIESENVSGQPLRAWFDEVDVDFGKSITGLVNEGLSKSKFFAIVMTPEYFNSGSGWTDAEWHAVLFDDPDNRFGRIIPILAKDCPNIPPLLKHLKYVDVRGNRYSRGLSQLVDKIAGRSAKRNAQTSNSFNHLSGSSIEQSQPDDIKERLTSNLLPIIKIPLKVYFGKLRENLFEGSDKETKAPSKNELKELLYKIQLEKSPNTRPYMPAFRTYKEFIVTFYNLNDNNALLSSIIQKGSVYVENTDDLMDNEDSLKLIVSLLNMAVSRHAFRCGLTQDSERNSRFYFPTDKGEANIIVWKSFKNQAQRTVAKPIKSFDDHSLWLHQGASIKLITLGQRFYLQIIPTWILTINGTTPASGSDVAKTVNKWTNAERNLSLVRHLKFWSSVLSGGKQMISIYCGSSFIKISPSTVEIEMLHGISDDQISLLDDSIEMTSVDDLIEGKLSDDFESDILEIEDFSEDEEDENYEEEHE